jgi:hypothetical protein
MYETLYPLLCRPLHNWLVALAHLGTYTIDWTYLSESLELPKLGDQDPIIGDKMAAELPPRASFLGLPAELRLLIYHFALVEPNGYPIQARQKKREYVPGRTRGWRFPVGRKINYLSWVCEPTLLLVSRQVRGEAYPVFYGENVFTTDHVRHAKSWLKYLRLRNAERALLRAYRPRHQGLGSNDGSGEREGRVWVWGKVLTDGEDTGKFLVREWGVVEPNAIRIALHAEGYELRWFRLDKAPKVQTGGLLQAEDVGKVYF